MSSSSRRQKYSASQLFQKIALHSTPFKPSQQLQLSPSQYQRSSPEYHKLLSHPTEKIFPFTPDRNQKNSVLFFQNQGGFSQKLSQQNLQQRQPKKKRGPSLSIQSKVFNEKVDCQDKNFSNARTKLKIIGHMLEVREVEMEELKNILRQLI